MNRLIAVFGAALASIIATTAQAQPSHDASSHDFVRCQQDGADTASLGCHIIANRLIGRLPPEAVYWHVDSFSNRADAENAAGSDSIVTEAYGQTWLMTIAGSAWRPNSGKRVATVGPLPVEPDRSYSAQYMAATFDPGMRTFSHLHPGPEAWVVLEGSQCLETPEGATTVSAGQSGIVRGGIPMVLFGVGTTRRKSLVLVLHETSQPPGVPQAWEPKGRCH
jgi:quercetin dioxygenase-like cupin family protein